jgi:hypothetical protein
MVQEPGVSTLGPQSWNNQTVEPELPVVECCEEQAGTLRGSRLPG